MTAKLRQCRKSAPLHTPVRALVASAVIAASCLLLGASPLGAQTSGSGRDPAPKAKPEAAPTPAPAPAPQPDARSAPAPKGAKPVLPTARSDGAKSLEKPPQTAEEKARALSDLYAQLAAADSEEAAKKLTGSIEQLWRISGSDTVNLLIARAGKAIGEDRLALAEKLLDNAVALAPDYPEAFNQRAYLYFKQNNNHAAVGDLRRAIALDPNHYKALEGLAQIWRETGDKKGAFGVMRQLLDVNPFATGARKVYEDLKREVEGQGI